MECGVELDSDSGVCTIRVTGIHRRPGDSQELLQIAGRHFREHGCTRFLFDMRRADIVGGTMAAYETVVDHDKFGVHNRFRVAAVYREVTGEERFMEDTAVNRGAIAYRVFNDVDVARKWVALDS